MDYDIPKTEQGMHDMVRFAEAEIKRSTLKIKKLTEIKDVCKQKLRDIEAQKEVKHGPMGEGENGQTENVAQGN